MSPNSQKYAFTLLKLGISLVLIAFLLNRLDSQVLLNLPGRFNFWFLIPLTLVFVGAQVLGSWRWQEVLKCHGLKQGLFRGVYLYLVGYFYNNFLPTAIGGDLVRGYEAAKDLGSGGKVASSILIERILGLIACLFLALLFLPLAGPPLPIVVMVLGLNLLSFLGVWFVGGGYGQNALRKVLTLAPKTIEDRLKKVLLDIDELRKNRKGLAMAFIAAVFYQGSLIWVAYLAGLFVQVKSLSFADYLVFVPLVWVVSLLPISFNALGIREISFSYFFGLLGATSENGFLVSLIFFATTLLTGLIGGILWGIFGVKAYFEKAESNKESKLAKVSFEESLIKKESEL